MLCATIPSRTLSHPLLCAPFCYSSCVPTPNAGGPRHASPCLASSPLTRLPQKLSELVRSEERSQQSESVLEAQARQLVHQYVVPAVNDSTSAVNGFVQKHVSGFSFANLFNSVSTGGAKK